MWSFQNVRTLILVNTLLYVLNSIWYIIYYQFMINCCKIHFSSFFFKSSTQSLLVFDSLKSSLDWIAWCTRERKKKSPRIIILCPITIVFLDKGGPRILWFFVPKGNQEIRGSQIVGTFLVQNPKLGPFLELDYMKFQFESQNTI